MTQRSEFTNAIEGNNLPLAADTAVDQRDTTIHMYVHRCILCAKHCDMIMQEKQIKLVAKQTYPIKYMQIEDVAQAPLEESCSSKKYICLYIHLLGIYNYTLTDPCFLLHCICNIHIDPPICQISTSAPQQESVHTVYKIQEVLVGKKTGQSQ